MEHLARRIDNLRGEFTAAGVETRVFLATWNQPFNGVDEIVFGDRFDDVMMIQPPTEEEVVEMIGLTTLADDRFGVRNTFYQYFLARLALNAVNLTGDYDFIVHTRSDLNIALGPFLPEWLARPDLYTTIHCREDGQAFINDQFSVAGPKVMLDAWTYRSLEDLRELFSTAVIPEDILQSMLTRSGITARQIQITQWELDPVRGSPYEPAPAPAPPEPELVPVESVAAFEPVAAPESQPENAPVTAIDAV
ncbi:hypothetical protein [Brevundimonas goettingensis]|uniref:Uncharacterized protein n=1 Tax=Brevundimonas goettingensis TaxID=2774190 RepID=A0A975BZW0_9CAUL|nr:hypothetical protein [Brevundimonas goettingensis]QTC91173.1 hypothetical protein IFJ75_18575 [Brevundimonas goettingensis]